jgi:plasmid stabilization system protein ParE
MNVEFTVAAEADLEEIGDYIARDNPVRALSFVRELARSCLELAEMPEAWPIVPRYQHHGIRRRVHGRYLIFYRITGSKITILHILNGAMDVDAILFPSG